MVGMLNHFFMALLSIVAGVVLAIALARVLSFFYSLYTETAHV